MRKILTVIAVAVAVIALGACGKSDTNSGSGGSGGGSGSGGSGGGGTTPTTRTDFVFGSDVSWVTEMEKDGKKFYDQNNNPKDLFQLFKSMGQKIIRLRIWVNPDGGWCGYDDVLAKAKRAQDAGLAVMLDFHYSNFFADPGTQTLPAAWNGKTHAELVALVKSYTTEFLTNLKLAKIDPAYIQIGNETRNGMLWPDGQLWNNNGDISGGWTRYAELSNAGYDAAKSVFSGAKVFVHLNHAYEDNVWWFDKFKTAGGKTDIIGLSHYPQVDKSGSGWASVNAEAVTNIGKLATATGKDIMIVETGIKASNFTDGASCLKNFIESIYNMTAVKGILYWEPEVYGGWKPAKYTTLGWNAYDMGAFTSEGMPSEVIQLFKN